MNCLSEKAGVLFYDYSFLNSRIMELKSKNVFCFLYVMMWKYNNILRALYAAINKVEYIKTYCKDRYYSINTFQILKIELFEVCVFGY